MPLKSKDEALDWLDSIEQNKRFPDGTKRASQYCWGRCDALVRKCRETEDVHFHRTALSKYVAYLKLGNSLLIMLFHSIYWRYLYGFKTPNWVTKTLSVPLEKDSLDTNDFFVSWSLIRNNHLMTMMTSKIVNTMTTGVEQNSEAGTTQS